MYYGERGLLLSRTFVGTPISKIRVTLDDNNIHNTCKHKLQNKHKIREHNINTVHVYHESSSMAFVARFTHFVAHFAFWDMQFKIF